ncbi:ParB N-terminal domain-containing protein [Syntrophorhabdus aromaticivorans]|jgi:ParB-like chromosome segregation protein Spo0J|uniref:ParB N-terminal domain-containing protein n=1 Tax=Syntrophorhabdus aromaticivorans TaxID=328301 RepID=UPI000407FCAA|nr:ParB N-terminal domain-containing protein [Syntrophorhabdus aromaticivorans]
MVNTIIKKVNLSELKPHPDNPRKISRENMDRLVKSLQEFPEMLEIKEIVVDETMTIIGGNMRYAALKKMGKEQCKAKIVTGLTEDQKREYIVKDNIALGEWEKTIIAKKYSDLDLKTWGIDLLGASMGKEELTAAILTEKERKEATKTADEISKALSEKIKAITAEDPKRINSAICIVVRNGRGNDFMVLADPNAKDIIAELKRYADAGEHSPLECLMRALT